MGHHVAAHKRPAAQGEVEGALGFPLRAGGQGGRLPQGGLSRGGATYPFLQYEVEPLHPSPHSIIPSSLESLSPLAWLPCLELCSRVRGSSTLQTLSRCWISGLSPFSSAVLLGRSPGDVYTPDVCRTTEVLPLVVHSSSSCLSTRP
jgi:hypothetical protein